MTQGNVVSMQSAKRKEPILPPVYQSVRNLAQRHIEKLISGLFDNTDDALFELADKSQSDHQQEMYFDSMRHIRLHRKTIEENFLTEFATNFERLLTPADSADVASDDYALVNQDELEMSVAVSGIASKVTSIYSLAIMQLTKRFGSVIAPVEVTELLNPLGPHALSSAFATAMSGVEVQIKIRIILMKLFERFVMERMGPVYEDVNAKFIQAGVLPDLKNTAFKNRSGIESPRSNGQSRSEANGQSVRQDGNQSTGSFGFQTIQSLLAGTRTSDNSGIPGQGTGSGALGSPGQPFITIPSDDLLSALSTLQQAVSFEGVDPDQAPSPADVRGLLLTKAGEGKGLGQADDDTVNFVGMLFDYILNDRNLAIPMKALIGRLQIPLVKLALLDKSFFSNSAHPARLLLNELSSAGIGWSSSKELKRDALYEKIEHVVAKVLGAFADDPSLFNDLLHELRAFVGQDTRRNVLVEQRVKDTELGKAKTREAKRAVQMLINQKACGLRLPAELGKFLSDVWSRVLTLQWVKFGEDSREWQQGVHSLDTLLWSLQPLSDPIDIDQRDELKIDLIGALQAGTGELGTQEDDTDAFFEWLSSHLEELSNSDRAFVEEDVRPEPSTPTAELEEIVLTQSLLKEVHLTDADEASLKLFTEGTWVEIQAPENTLRCKLATVTQPDRNFIFVNRRGMKILEKSVQEMLELVGSEEIRLIDESQVFDRALQSVIGNLRKLHRQAS
ncbi:MAG: DUF1631 family protein [Pseudomonadales bacterium]|nr:DUF1631 family protein [Pseudomonadales bacterium]